MIRLQPDKEDETVKELLPRGEELRRAIKWISENLKDDAGQPVQPLVQKAIFKFNLSPKDSEFVINFYRKGQGGE